MCGCGGDDNDEEDEEEEEDDDGGMAAIGGEEEREEGSDVDGIPGSVDCCCCRCCCCSPSTFSLSEGCVKKAELQGPTPSTGRFLRTVIMLQESQ